LSDPKQLNNVNVFAHTTHSSKSILFTSNEMLYNNVVDNNNQVRVSSISRFLFFALLMIGVWSCKKDPAAVPQVDGAPKITLTNEVIITTLGSDFFLEADLADSAGIKSFTVRYDDWYLYNTVSLADLNNPHRYHVKYKFRMPDTAANKTHSIDLTATNVGNKETKAQFKIMLNSDFPKMYATETLDPTVLTKDLFGVPMLVDKTSSYNYSATYYSAQANTKIWFIPSKSTAKPFAYGLDPKDPTKLTGDVNSAQPLTLSERGYYSIKYNTLNLSYSITKLPDPNPANAFPQVAIAGMGFYDYPNMYWQNTLPDIILMDKDPLNPYRFTKTVRLGIPPGQTYNVAEFIFTTNNGWTDFWRFDSGTDPEFTVPNGGSTGGDFPITNTPVTYKVTFDSYLNRAKFERQ
jgi:hypothetical protein